MTFCITGASGFIGSHLVAALLRMGHQVRVLVHRSERQFPEGVAVVRGSLLDLSSIEKFVHPGDVVINMAYLGADPRANIQATANLAAVCRDRVARFLHVSTAAVFGSASDVVVDETTRPRPSGEYQTVKYEAERILIDSVSQPGVLTIVRPTAVFGVGGRNLLQPARQIRRGPAFVNYLRRSLLGERRLNLVAVENVVEAILHLSSAQMERNPVFIVSDDDDPLNHYAAVSAILASEFHCPTLDAPPIPGLSKLLPPILHMKRAWPRDPRQVFSPAKVKASGYRPAITFEAAVRRYAAWLRSANGFE